MVRTRRKGIGVTIQTVAERAGVSAMTVFYAINGTGCVGAATREVVLEAAHALDYKPNAAAQSLASAVTCGIVVVYQNSQSAFLSVMLVGALNAISRLGAELTIGTVEPPVMADAGAAMRGLARCGASGILLAPPCGDLVRASGLVGALGVPVAAVDRLRASPHRRRHRVGEPRFECAAPGGLSGPARGGQANITCEALVRPGRLTFESDLAAGEALLDLEKAPTAILASNDGMASCVSSPVHRRNLRVPPRGGPNWVRRCPNRGEDLAIVLSGEPAGRVDRRARHRMTDRQGDRKRRCHRRTVDPDALEVVERESTAFDLPPF
jgi:LacI family transcriptional regulator